MKKNILKLLAVIFVFSLIFSLLAFPASAEYKVGDVIEDFSDAESWEHPDSATVFSSENAAKEKVLAAVLTAKAGYNSFLLAKDYKEPLDMFYINSIASSFDVFADDSKFSSVQLGIRLIFEDEESYSATIAYGGISTPISCELSAIPGGKLLKRAELHISFRGEGDGSVAFSLESISVSDVFDSARAERFFCENFRAESRSSLKYSEEPPVLSVTFNGSSAYIEGKVGEDQKIKDTNALRITVSSASRDAALAFSYSSYGEEYTEAHTATLDIERADTERTYTVPLASAGEISELKIALVSGGRTVVVFSSIIPVSTYIPQGDKLGEVTSASVSQDKENIIIKGKLSTAAGVRYKDSHLSLYQLSPWDDAERVLESDTSPVATAEISTRFEFRLPIKDEADLLSKYVITVEKDGRTVTPLVFADAPCYISGLEVFGEDIGTERKNSFKGVLSPLEGYKGEYGAGTVVLDVDLSKLISNKNTGYLHKVGGRYYYFSREETDKIDRAVSAYTAAGGNVLLRLLATNPREDVPYTYGYNVSGVFFYGLNAESEEGRNALFAVTDFLSVRYTKNNSSIGGFVLGKNIDRGGEYNYIGTDMSLNKYTEKYLYALRTVYSAAKMRIADARIYVGIGDSWKSDNVGREFLYPNYDTSLLLEALCAHIEDECGGVEFTVLSESSKNPDIYSENGLDIFRLSVAEATLLRVRTSFGAVEEKPFLLWAPESYNGGEYALLYYSTLFSEKAEGFAVSVDNISRECESIIENIDTVSSLNATHRALVTLGVKDVTTYFENYNEKKIVLRDIRSYSLSLLEKIKASGSVTLYGGASLLELSKLSYSGGAGKPDVVNNRTAARIVGRGTVYYNFDTPIPLSVFPSLSLSLMLEADSEREVTVSLYSDSTVYTYKAFVAPGRSFTFYIDGEKTGADKIRRIGIGVDGDGLLSFGDIKGRSNVYNSDGLLAAYEAELSRAAGESPVKRDIVAVAAVVAITLLSLILAFANKRKENEELKEKKR